MNILMVKEDEKISIQIKQVMVRLPVNACDILEIEAKSMGTTLAAYCREILLDHIKRKDQKNELAPVIRDVVQELLRSDDLDEEFGQKVAKALSKRYN